MVTFSVSDRVDIVDLYNCHGYMVLWRNLPDAYVGDRYRGDPKRLHDQLQNSGLYQDEIPSVSYWGIGRLNHWSLK